MKLIAQGKISEALPIDRVFLLNSDLNKIPLFHLEPIPTSHKNSTKFRFVVDNEKNIVALVSDKFVLTQPREIIKQLVGPFQNEIETWKIYYRSGVVMVKLIWSKLLEVEDIKFKPGILVRDSVTKAYRLKISYAPYVSKCGNELLFTQFAFSRKHVGLIKRDLQMFINKFREWLFNNCILEVMYERMQKEKIDKNTFENILKDLDLPQKYVKGIKWCNGYTLWNLYMDLTNRLSMLNAPIQYHIRVSRLTRI